MFWRLTLVIFCAFCSAACGEEEPRKAIVSRKDTVQYFDEPGYSILLAIKGDSTRLIKRTYWEGFPEGIDTLVRESNGMWWSRRYTTRYQVTDTCVNWWFDLKVVHPSSNWQGQTPGIQREPFTGRRF